MTEIVMDMYHFHVWANRTILKRLKEIPREVYTQELTSVFPSVSKVMPHIYITDLCWYRILSGENMSDAMEHAHGLKEQIEALELEELEVKFSELAESYKALLGQLKHLDQTIVVDNPYAGIRDTSYSEIILQTVNHATYHRGNITAMLRQMGYPSVMTEYALYWYSK
ncbi:DinB family protein [Paenibacillus thalictri]|uniref:Damage-inducible protein DinB n=1 Tax=Paenibacillus thalictri TaxID=2527873 RepID=A0A4Q9DYX7_9BACL|nr:DinB family protein [Paenibacillus thalictri]TBL81665.1 damage-inducible protein DinB [Paenibacillus thalictri]